MTRSWRVLPARASCLSGLESFLLCRFESFVFEVLDYERVVALPHVDACAMAAEVAAQEAPPLAPQPWQRQGAMLEVKEQDGSRSPRWWSSGVAKQRTDASVRAQPGIWMPSATQ
ncbi:MAG: hypothetical protein ACLP0J_25910 [Solirubrobacteraceae bacterium]